MTEPSQSIADLSLQCSQHFITLKRLIADAPGSSTSNPESLPHGFVPSLLLDILARFQIWTGNIGALQIGKSSLDYRIRKTNVRDEIIRLLKQVELALTDLKAILNGSREQQTWYEGTQMEFTDSEDDSDSDTSSVISQGEETPDEEDPRLVTESGQLLVLLGDLVRGLLKLSIIIQKSSRRGKFTHSSREKPYETKFDILHAVESFPYAMPTHEQLLERLGKANAQRRQWLLYRRHHREKLSSRGGSTSGHVAELGAETLGTRGQMPTDFSSTSSLSSRPAMSYVTADNSTIATTFYDSTGDTIAHGGTDEASSEVSFSASSVSGVEKTPLIIPSLPSEAATGDPFECPFCFSIITVSSLQVWIKHVHADLASYVCTFENCTAPLFENRMHWFEHEMQTHRRLWSCIFCEHHTSNLADLEEHLLNNHGSRIPDGQLRAIARQESHPLTRLPASACPLCDYEATLKDRIGTNIQEQFTIKPEQLRSHLGRHLEQFALFVLPKSALMQDDADDDENYSDQRDSDSGQLESGQDFEMDDTQYDIESVLGSQSDLAPHILTAAPALALGWQPPHDFTPPMIYFETDDEDLVPRREESTFGGDLFTPGWVRGFDKKKEGYCARCEVGHWVNIPSGEYEFHLTYLHGLPRSGVPLPRPSVIREVEGNPGIWEAYCDMCSAWRVLRKTKRGWNWWRHCLVEHDAMNPAGEGTTASPNAPAIKFNPEGEGMTEAIACVRQSNLKNLKAMLGENPTMAAQHDNDMKYLLHYAAEAGRLDMVEYIIEFLGSLSLVHGLPTILNAQSSKGFTPIMLAADQGNQEVVECLLRHGVRLDLPSASGSNALDLAAHSGYTTIADLLIRNGARVNEAQVFRQVYLRPKHNSRPDQALSDMETPTGDGAFSWSELTDLVSRNDLPGIRRCLDQGVDMEETAKGGQTALMLAISKGNTEAAELLIENGANLNATNSKGWTALMNAVRDGNLQVVDFLLKQGADANHLSPDHWTALAEAAQSGHIDILRLLLLHGADTEVRSSHDWTPLMHACYRGDKACVDVLLRAGAGVESGSQRDETPMLLAAASGHTDIVRDLLAAGALPDASWARKEVTSKSHAREFIERTYQLGWTPLMVACQNGHENVVRLLLDAGANCEPRSPMKRDAMEIARENGRTSILTILESRSLATSPVSE